jgi:DNA processing protein
MTGNNSEELKYWLALTFIKDIGPITVKKLLSVFHTPRNVLEAPLKELQKVEDIKTSRARAIHSFDSWDLVELELSKIGKLGIKAITFTDKSYPESLRQIDDSPILLYIKGTITDEDRYAIGIVGSRNMSPYGKSIAGTFAAELAAKGFTIVSGMARGIDTTAHKGALKAKGRSIAVLGCGIDTPYPPENTALFEELAQNGAVISEFPLGTPPNRENFPKRNRLISGLSLGVLIVEASAGSGSLITAHYALEQGKEIFAVPGSITSMNSVGTNALIKKGAKLVQNVDDIIGELTPLLKGLLRNGPDKTDKRGHEMITDLGRLEINNEEKAICNVLGSEPRHIDVISRETGIAPQKLSGILLDLELKGVVKQTEGKRFFIL